MPNKWKIVLLHSIIHSLNTVHHFDEIEIEKKIYRNKVETMKCKKKKHNHTKPEKLWIQKYQKFRTWSRNLPNTKQMFIFPFNCVTVCICVCRIKFEAHVYPYKIPIIFLIALLLNVVVVDNIVTGSIGIIIVVTSHHRSSEHKL